MVFYRKYRPQTIAELDSREIREKLYNVLKGAEVPHAFIFAGPKGLGKTSTARIVAKSLNCEKKIKGVEPCNKCEQCMSITSGTNMDILEIDGASNRGIDEIRDLREKIKLSPMGARKKVYIIDEVHMLTAEAFNALLKTLEEPPSHVVFILCTTESHKIPGTIMSRCVLVQFKKATEEELIRSFERITKSEGLDTEKEALRLIAGFSDGSFRDGVKILEEVALITKNKKITKELIEKNFSVAGTQYRIAEIINFLENRDVKGAFELITKLVNEGVEMGYFMQGVVEVLHNTLLYKAGLEDISGPGLVLDNSKLKLPEIKRMIELLSKARSELKYAVLPQIPLELAVVEWGIQPVLDKAGGGSVEPSSSPALLSGPLPTDVRRELTPSTPVSSARQSGSLPKITQQGMAQYSEHDALWTALIDNVKLYNHSVAGVLRGCIIKGYDGKILLLETNYKFHKDKLSEAKTKDLLSKACRQVTKKDVKIEIVLKPAVAKASAFANASADKLVGDGR